jgi:hypothetical protein
MPERRHATCQLVNDVALIAAPPVENSAAAARSFQRARDMAGIRVRVGTLRAASKRAARPSRAAPEHGGTRAGTMRMRRATIVRIGH